MESIEMATASVTTPEGRSIALRYCLLAEPLLRPDGEPAMGNYGVSVTSRCGAVEETERVESISPNLERVEKLVECLADNTVLPITLHDVVEDMLGG